MTASIRASSLPASVRAKNVEAHFWAANGVEVFKGWVLPNPPPHTYRFALREPISFVDIDTYTPEMVATPQIAEFRLTDWDKGSEVAHYVLDSKPRKGWEWLIVGDTMRAERLP